MKTMYMHRTWTIEPIQSFEVEKETEKSVWIGGNRNSKSSSWGTYRDTHQEALQDGISYWEEKKSAAESELKIAAKKIKELKELEE